MGLEIPIFGAFSRPYDEHTTDENFKVKN